jgi:bacterioferritin-associated ferredoxin
MYVCICNAVTDSAIRQAVSEGARSLRDLSAQTGCSTQCGRCVHVARDVLDEALSDLGCRTHAIHLPWRVENER